MEPAVRGGRDAPGGAATSKCKPRAELDLPGIVRCGRDIAKTRRRGDAHGIGRERRARIGERGVVEHIEELAANLHLHAFRDLDIFEERGIKIDEVGTSERVSTQTAERVERGHLKYGSGVRGYAAGQMSLAAIRIHTADYVRPLTT